MKSLRHTWFDRVLPWLLGAGVAALAWFTGNSLELPPELWDEVAVAAKLRPPVHEFPLLWQKVLSVFIRLYGISDCIQVLKILGAVSLSVLTVQSFRFFEGCIPSQADDAMRRSVQGRWIKRLILIQCAVIFVCSEPVWLAGRVLSPEMFMLLLLFLVLRSAQLSFSGGGVLPLLLTGGLSGFMAAETPLAVLPPLFCGLHLWLKDWAQASDELHPFADPAVCAAAIRRMIWCFILFYIVGVFNNLSFFIANGGGGEPDAKVFIAAVKYLLNYFTVVKGAASPFGFFLIAAMVVLPLTIAAARVKTLVDTDRFLPIPYACFLAVAGITACSQSFGFLGCHFWRWTPNAVSSQYLLCLGIFGTVMISLIAICVFIVDVFFRDHERLMRDSFSGEEYENALPEWRLVKSTVSFVKALRPVMIAGPVACIVFAVAGRLDGTVRGMSSIVNDIVRQTAAECDGANMLFTDGSLDAAVEVCAKSRGCDLKVLSMMSRSGKYDVAVRQRGETNEANRALLSIGAADALRTWVTTKEQCVSNIALQVGIELWQRHNLPMPEAGGLVSRTAGYPSGMARSYAKSARDIAERILRLYDDGNPIECGYPELNGMFLFGQWRLSRMCRLRANEADGSGDAAMSETEHSLADRLDRRNPEWQKVQEKMDWIGRQDGMRLTPREGLKLGLERADFRLARSYARRVIASDADDVQANFALGMGYFIEKQYGRAEMHLRKCLIKAPDQPAVLNNLAIVQLRLGRYAEAETNAVRALELFPNSSEIKTTLRHIRAAKEGRPADK